ncbi:MULTISPECIES: hypothetical protein [Paraburkholderia]|uniref:Uncharacterized protein n=1 Tax=Paraburkholderia ferrariae TaxID=386056 RepID=A0ABU9RMZ0_9BURK|nr:hypothetical protein [Paraburkholderia nodosa]
MNRHFAVMSRLRCSCRGPRPDAGGYAPPGKGTLMLLDPASLCARVAEGATV